MSSDTVEERARAMIDELRKIRQRYQVEMGRFCDGVAYHGGNCQIGSWSEGERSVVFRKRNETCRMDVEERTEKIKKDYLIISEALNHLEFEAVGVMEGCET